MSSLKETIETAYQPVLSTLPENRHDPFSPPVTVMDDLTYQLVQMPDLLRAVDTSVTHSGSLVLERSLRQPPTALALIKAKQEAVRELSCDDRLRHRVTQYLQEAASTEGEFYSYFHGDYTLMPYKQHPNLYDAFKGTRNFLRFISENTEGIEARSPYLNLLLAGLHSLTQSEIYDWIKNPLYKTPWGLRNKAKTPSYLPRIRFFANDFTPNLVLFNAAAAFGMSSAFGLALDLLYIIFQGRPEGTTWKVPSIMTPFTVTFLQPAETMMGMHRSMDNDWFVKPMGKRCFGNQDVMATVDRLGEIDELLSFVKYGERVNGSVVSPDVTDDSPHQFYAQGLRNPTLAVDNSQYVPNDVNLNGARLTFITGPNSGGKTFLCKSIAQAQILAQLGCPIPAETAQIAIADKVFYHAPMINSLQDEEGRFGIEAGRTRDLFFQATPKTLIILDELLEATTFEERLAHSQDILDAFCHIGNNTVLVTHNHQLVQSFREETRGQFWQVEFDGDRPTYRKIEGISTESHAYKVLERLGFTREDMFRHLREHGYIT